MGKWLKSQCLNSWLDLPFAMKIKLLPSLPSVQLANGKWNGSVSIPGAGLASKGLQED